MARMSTGSSRPLLVWCAGVSWTGVAGTDKQMVAALRDYADVLWVDPPISPLTPARYRHGASRFPFPSLVRVDESVLRLTPKALPLHTRGAMRSVTSSLVRAQIRYALRKIGRRPRAVVASHLDDVLGRWDDGMLSVFYGTDDFVGGAELMGIDRRRVELEEKAQLDRADILVAISDPLAQRWRQLGFKRPLVLVPNGVNVENYRNIGDAPAANIDLDGPIAGFVGHLSSRIDVSLLESVVDAGCSLLLVGPYDSTWEPERFKALVAHPRVRWVGRVEFEKLPSYLKIIDVGITPYVDSEFNRASFPLKTLEYLAAGKAVVSTDLPAVHWLQTDLIKVATHESFGEVTAAEAIVASQLKESARQRVEFAESHSWASRARVFAEALGIA